MINEDAHSSRKSTHGKGLWAVTIIAILASSSARAVVTPYTTQASFSAATTITNTATFELFNIGPRTSPLTDDDILLTKLAIDLYIVGAGGALTLNSVSFPTQSLSANGDENFDFRLASGATFDSIGIDYATNSYAAPVLSLYTPGNVLIGSFTVPLGHDTLGFFGSRSSTPIGYARSIVTNGSIEDSAVDNVRIGVNPAVAAVPEPAIWGLLLTGFGAVGIAARRRQHGVVVA